MDERIDTTATGDDGRTVPITFKFRRDSVELWADEHLAGSFDRDLLRAWLDGTCDIPIRIDDAVISLDWASGLVVALPQTRGTVLPFDVEDRLRAAV